MKHATAQTLAAAIPELLAQLRALPQLSERTPGCFYRKSQALLHFHEDPAGLFVDVKLDLKTFTRMPVNSQAERDAFVAALRRATGGWDRQQTPSK